MFDAHKHKKYFQPLIPSYRWGKRAAHNRAQIVYYIAENLELRCGEFAQKISAMTGKSIEEAKKEVDLSIQRLFYWGAYADKYGGTVQVSEIFALFVLRFCASICLCSFCYLTIGIMFFLGYYVFVVILNVT